MSVPLESVDWKPGLDRGSSIKCWFAGTRCMSLVDPKWTCEVQVHSLGQPVCVEVMVLHPWAKLWIFFILVGSEPL